MNDLIAYSESSVLASATLSGNQLVWVLSDPSNKSWWNSCDSLQIHGSVVPSFWLAIETGSMTLDRHGFPQNFYIVTPFFVYWCSLGVTWSQGVAVWTLNGSIPLSTGPRPVQPLQFNLPVNTDPVAQWVPPGALGLPVNAFTSVPANFSLLDTSGTTSVSFSFAVDASQSGVLRVSSQGDQAGHFWDPFPRAGGAYQLVFSYLIRQSEPVPYLEVSGLDPSGVAGFWTQNIAGQYLISVRAAQPDVPISVLFTVPSPGSIPWLYRALIDLETDNIERTVTWNQGCFTVADGGNCEFQAPDLLMHDGTAFQMNATAVSVFPDTTLPGTANTMWPTFPPAFVIQFVSVSTPQAQSLRLGALDLTFAAGASTNQSELPFSMFGYLEPGFAYGPRSTALVPRVSISNLQIGVTVQVG